MKVTNLRRKLAAALVAGGLLSPAAAAAADLDTNLILNPGFENLDATDSHILDWTDGTDLGLTYASGVYDNGGPLAGGGDFYFTSNNSISGEDVAEAGVVAQSIDLSAGDTGTLIATGNAQYSLHGFFTTYLGDNDFGSLQVEFLDSGSQSLGSASVGPSGNVQDWTVYGQGGTVPVGTSSVLVSVFGSGTSGGPDAYLDNVNFSVGAEVVLPVLDLQIDRQDGSLVLSNQTGGAVDISGYEISSAFEALSPADWVSITDNYDANSGGDVDMVNNWSELTQSGAHGDLSEGDLESGTGGSLANGQSIVLGNAGTWIRNSNEDLIIRYVTTGSAVVTGITTYDNGDTYLFGDVDTDGDIDADDWAIVRGNQHGDLSGESLAEAYRRGDLTGDLENNFADFVTFKDLFDGANGAGSFVAMLSGVGVPEPTSAVIVLTAGLLLGVTRPRSGRDR